MLASSCAVYGDADALPLGEDVAPRPLSPYAVAKLASEETLVALAGGGGPTAVCLRLFNVYGPRQDPGSEYSGVIARFAEAAVAGSTVTVSGTVCRRGTSSTWRMWPRRSCARRRLRRGGWKPPGPAPPRASPPPS